MFASVTIPKLAFKLDFYSGLTEPPGSVEGKEKKVAVKTAVTTSLIGFQRTELVPL